MPSASTPVQCTRCSTTEYLSTRHSLAKQSSCNARRARELDPWLLARHPKEIAEIAPPRLSRIAAPVTKSVRGTGARCSCKSAEERWGWGSAPLSTTAVTPQGNAGVTTTARIDTAPAMVPGTRWACGIATWPRRGSFPEHAVLGELIADHHSWSSRFRPSVEIPAVDQL